MMQKVRLLKTFHPWAIALPLLILAQPALAQQASGGARRFTVADFQQFAPVNALDLVSRIPGFSIQDGDGRRGFGENAGNVLIDGDRPSTKTDDIFTILGRIPVSQVAYIELTESAGGDGEARGRAQIVNVVRSKSTQPSGTYEGGLTAGSMGGIVPYATGAVTLKHGAATWDLNSGYSQGDFRGAGPEDFFDGSHVFQERRFYDGHGGFKEGTFGAALKTRIGGAKVNANTKLSWQDGFDDRLGDITGPGGLPKGVEDLRDRGPTHNIGYELGGDIELPTAAKLTSKLVGLWRYAPDFGKTSIATSFVAAPDTFYAVNSRQRSNEGILRMQNDWTRFSGHAIQFGAELAYNRLRSSFSQSSGQGGAIIQLPASNVTVAEWRVEPFLSDVWSLSSDWKLEAGAVYEASWLHLSGDSQAQRSLQFLKPRIVATWTASKATSLELRAERDVSQLDFSEFATSVDLSIGNQVDAGNAELVPERTWVVSATLRQKFMERGSVQLKTEYQWVSATQDLVPITLRDTAGNITAQFDGAGNIGASRRWNIESEILLPFDWITKPLGIKGMEVKWTAHYHGSQVTDPVTGLHRRTSGRPLWHQNWAFRHDIAKAGISWGFTAFKHAPSTQYFFNQITRADEDTDLSLFVEYKKLKIGTLSFQVFDTTTHLVNRDRTFFQDTRASGIPTSFIERDRRFERRYRLSLSGKF